MSPLLQEQSLHLKMGIINHILFRFKSLPRSMFTAYNCQLLYLIDLDYPHIPTLTITDFLSFLCATFFFFDYYWQVRHSHLV